VFLNYMPDDLLNLGAVERLMSIKEDLSCDGYSKLFLLGPHFLNIIYQKRVVKSDLKYLLEEGGKNKLNDHSIFQVKRDILTELYMNPKYHIRVMNWTVVSLEGCYFLKKNGVLCLTFNESPSIFDRVHIKGIKRIVLYKY